MADKEIGRDISMHILGIDIKGKIMGIKTGDILRLDSYSCIWMDSL